MARLGLSLETLLLQIRRSSSARFRATAKTVRTKSAPVTTQTTRRWRGAVAVGSVTARSAASTSDSAGRSWGWRAVGGGGNLAALRKAEQCGEGSHLDISMCEGDAEF